MLSAERLKELLTYSPETGLFFWNSGDRLVGVNAGRDQHPAGSINSRGYRTIRIDGKYYKAHRLAFLYMNGCWPTGVVDHLNWTPDDNRWLNLRDVSQAVNAANRNPSANKHGVHFHTQKRRWEARIMRDRRRVYLGSFASKEAAMAARAAALAESTTAIASA